MACGHLAAVPADAPPAPTRYAPPQRPARQPDLQLQFRFKALQSLTDLDPPRIEAAIRELDGIVRFEVFDDRASDATFVTLVIELSERDAAHLAELQRALLSIRNVQALAVNPSGRTTPVQGRRAPPRRPMGFIERVWAGSGARSSHRGLSGTDRVG